MSQTLYRLLLVATAVGGSLGLFLGFVTVFSRSGPFLPSLSGSRAPLLAATQLPAATPLSLNQTFSVRFAPAAASPVATAAVTPLAPAVTPSVHPAVSATAVPAVAAHPAASPTAMPAASPTAVPAVASTPVATLSPSVSSLPRTTASPSSRASLGRPVSTAVHGLPDLVLQDFGLLQNGTSKGLLRIDIGNLGPGAVSGQPLELRGFDQSGAQVLQLTTAPLTIAAGDFITVLTSYRPVQRTMLTVVVNPAQALAEADAPAGFADPNNTLTKSVTPP